MASAVDIANLALSHLGDAATISSLSPAEGSPQAQHCARFYPEARDAVLEEFDWTFAMRRAKLAQLSSNPATSWQYCYAVPNGCLCMVSILPPDAIDDYEGQTSGVFVSEYYPGAGRDNRMLEPQPYAVEQAADGTQSILTNQPNAVLRYKAQVTDPNAFSPLARLAMSYLLASMIAGPLMKGSEGAQKSKEMLALYEVFKNKAIDSDAGHGRIVVTPITPWMAGR